MKTEIRWGIILGVVFLLWNVLMAVCGFHGDFIEYHAKVDSLFFVPFVLIYYLALKQIRDIDLGGDLSFSRGMKSSLISVCVALPVFLLSTYITTQFISPGFFSNAINTGVRMGQDESMLESVFNLKSYLLMTCVYTVLGLIVGAVATFLLRRKRA